MVPLSFYRFSAHNSATIFSLYMQCCSRQSWTSLSGFICVHSLPPDGTVNTLCPPIVVQDVWYGRWEKQRDHSGPRRSLGLNLVSAHSEKRERVNKRMDSTLSWLLCYGWTSKLPAAHTDPHDLKIYPVYLTGDKSRTHRGLLVLTPTQRRRRSQNASGLSLKQPQ